MLKFIFNLLAIFVLFSNNLLAQDSLRTAVKNKLLNDTYAFNTYLLLTNRYLIEKEVFGITCMDELFIDLYNCVNPFCRLVGEYSFMNEHFSKIYGVNRFPFRLGNTSLNKKNVKRMINKRYISSKTMRNPRAHYKKLIQSLPLNSMTIMEDDYMIHYLKTDTIPTPLID